MNDSHQGAEPTLDGQWAKRWLELANRRLASGAQELNELDQAIGDGDHGANMSRGFAALAEKLAAEDGAASSLADVFKTAAMTLLSTVGGASGPLYGSVFLGMSKAAASYGEGALGAPGVAELMDAASAAVVQRGKAEVGDKTMLDALAAAREASKVSADAGACPCETLAAAANAAAAGASSTAPLVARKGRASYLGERSQGTVDPGALSAAWLLAAALEAAGESAGEGTKEGTHGA